MLRIIIHSPKHALSPFKHHSRYYVVGLKLTRFLSTTHLSRARSNPKVNQEPVNRVSGLRPYQEECIDVCLNNLLEKGIKKQVVSLAVGSGKTVIFSNLINRLPCPKEGADKVLVLAHREELIEHAKNQILRFNPDFIVGIDKGKSQPYDIQVPDVIIGSVATLGRKNSKRLQQYNKDDFKAILIDEAHHASAASYLRILDHFEARDSSSHIFVWGCSATLRRADGVDLNCAFDHISYHKRLIDMIKDGWLSNIRVIQVQSSTDLTSIPLQKSSPELSPVLRDFNQTTLSTTINNESRNKLVLSSYLSHASDRRSILIFAVNIAHVNSLVELFRENGIEAKGVSSKTKTEERRSLIDDFRKGKLKVLINCGILTEGTDIPNIDCLIMARPTRSNVLFQQMLGRGLRTSPGKSECLVIDVVDIFQSPGLITTPTLIGLPPTFDFENQLLIKVNDDIETFKRQAGMTEEKLEMSLMKLEKLSELQKLKITGTMNDETGQDGGEGGVELTMRMKELSSGETLELLTEVEEIDSKSEKYELMSRHDWVWVSKDVRALSLAGGKVIKVFKVDDDTYTAVMKSTIQVSPPSQSSSSGFNPHHRLSKPKTKYIQRTIPLPLFGKTLNEILQATDTYISRHHFSSRNFFLKTAKWKKEKASDKQKEFLKMRGIGRIGHGVESSGSVSVEGHRGGKGSFVDLEKITKGEAMRLLMRINEGGVKEEREEIKAKEKIRKFLEIRRKQVADTEVKVGWINEPAQRIESDGKE